MTYPVSRSMLSRLLSVATVLTLVGFAASADLQPESALASPGQSADLGAGVVSLADDTNDNGDENRDENRDDDEHRNNDENRNHDENNNDENRNHDDNGNNEHNGNTGGQGIFSTICSVPGFAINVGCSSGLLGN